MPGKQARFWCFTLNNYVEAELVSLRTSLSQEKVRYAVFGFEEGEEKGTPHLQGYVSFKKPQSLTACKTVVGNRAHLAICKGDEAQNYKYCTKGGNYEEFGKPTKSGKRSDIQALQEAVLKGERDLKKMRMDPHLGQVVAKYPRFVNDLIRDLTPAPPLKTHPLRDWQQDLNRTLNREPDDRTVFFVVDLKGNNGKSWFAKYYCMNHDKAVILRPTKHADMAYALPNELRVVFLDCTRKQVEYIPYTFMEELKDGLVFSNKYESCVKRYPNVHVVVLMNQDPDMEALSADRYEIIRLS